MEEKDFRPYQVVVFLKTALPNILMFGGLFIMNFFSTLSASH